MKVTPETLKSRIGAAKSTVKDKCLDAKSAAKKLAIAYDAMLDAEEKKDKSDTKKALVKFAAAENVYASALKAYRSALSLYDSLVEDVVSLYDELIALEKPKALKKVRSEAEKFERQEKNKRDAVVAIVGAIKDACDLPEPCEKKAEEMAEPIPTAAHESARLASQPVSIAPMSIDISSIVEEAVFAAMDKFKIAFAKRADAFIENMPSGTEVRPVESPTSLDTVQAEELVLNEQRAITERLALLTDGLKSLSDRISALSDAYTQLAGKQQEAAELQRKINDMQRAVSREIQGVQANQKVINQDQAALSAEQAFVLEAGKANLESQKLLADAQGSVSEMQKTVIETQSAVEESMREVMNSQKEMISLQQSVISGNAKNIELSRALAEKQSAVTTLQKTVMSEHKQLARSQRAVSNKNKPKSTQPKTVAQTANEIVEAKAEEEKLSLPEEVVLSEISAEEKFKTEA